MYINNEYKRFVRYEIYNDLNSFTEWRNEIKYRIYYFFDNDLYYKTLVTEEPYIFFANCHNISFYELRYILEYIGKMDDIDFINKIFEKNNKIFATESDFIKAKEIFNFRQKNTKNISEIIEFLKKINIKPQYFDKISMDVIYDNIVPNNLKRDSKFIIDLLHEIPSIFRFIYIYISEKDKYAILDECSKEIYVYGKNLLTKEEYNYVTNKLKEKIKGNKDIIIDILLEEKELSKYQYRNNSSIEYMDDVYNTIVTENLKCDSNFISPLLDKFPSAFPFVYKFIDKKDIYTILDKYFIAVYKYYILPYRCKKLKVTEEEYNYIIEKIKESGNSSLLYRSAKYDDVVTRAITLYHSNIIEKLREKHNKSYNAYATKNNVDPDDDWCFIKTIINSKHLDEIFLSDNFDISDIKVINFIINYLEEKKVDCTNINKRINCLKQEGQKREIYTYNQILANKDNEQKLNELLAKLNVNKENFFEFIKTRKYLDKKMKEAALLALAKHFKTGYISIYDIIDLMQEMSEREFTIDEILKEKEIDKKLFYSIYDKFKEENPEMYELISKNLNDNKIRGFKKIIKLYYAIMSDKISDYNGFVEQYGYTPEEVLKMFASTDFYDDLFKFISSWYTIKDDSMESVQVKNYSKK